MPRKHNDLLLSIEKDDSIEAAQISRRFRNTISMASIHPSRKLSFLQLLLQESGINILCLSIPLTQHRLDCNRLVKPLSKTGPLPISSRALILILSKSNLIRPLIPSTPNRPPSRIYRLGKFCRLYHNPGEISPRPPKVVCAISNAIPWRSRYLRVIDDVPARVIRRAARGSHPACVDVRFTESNDANVAFLEPGLRALAEDEIRGAFDVRLCVELGAGLREEGVLVAEQGAGVVALLLQEERVLVN